MSRRLSGLRAWLWQRITAVYLAGYVLWFLGAMMWCPPDDYADWYRWISAPTMSIATTLFFAALLLHAWVGVRDVIIDYIHAPASRLLALSVLGLFLLSCAVWLMQIVVRA